MKRWTTALMTLTILACTSLAQACPLCKDAIPNSDAQAAGSLPGGFNYSIYYMLCSLFCVIAGFGFFIVRTIRTTDRVAGANSLSAVPHDKKRIQD